MNKYLSYIDKVKVALITDGISPFVIGGMQKHSTFLAKYS